MVTYRVRIEGGRKGLLMNPKTEEILDCLRNRKPQPKRDWTVAEEAAYKIIRNAQGMIGVPDQYIWACLVKGGEGFKFKGMRNLSTKDSSLLGGMIDIICGEDEFIPFVDQNAEWVPTKMGGRNPSDKVAVTIVRPLFRRWVLEFVLEIDNGEVDSQTIRKLVERAGKFVGLGDFRPACKGRFGKFVVTVWEKIGGDEERPVKAAKGEGKAEARSSRRRAKVTAALAENADLPELPSEEESEDEDAVAADDAGTDGQD